MIVNSQGYIALTSVLVLSAIFMSISIGMALQSIHGADLNNALNKNEAARDFAFSCSDYARMELQRKLDYQGNEVILMTEGDCEILSIQGNGNTDRILQVQSSVGPYTYRIEDVIEVVSPVMVVTSSKRVISFK